MKKDLLTTVREWHEIQGRDGNWNYSPYMKGLYNGLELVLAEMEEREPVFRDSPEIWRLSYVTADTPAWAYKDAAPTELTAS